ncbi:S-layer homology domain-containing protein [Paenibacillus daejeonensis]|uniref:S-layer homology domain-containing protein n=1 Tax=Paenibacillus daejeonensis TaxID=135193 RepID=UPI00146E3BDF|nr:S-layer homology domain-containing protein [Paenibacillus daejeonensis]
MLSLIMLLSFSTLVAAADPQPVFAISASATSSEVGQEVRVTITGDHLKDMYGFEIQFTYDKSRLKFERATTAIAGFSVPAHEEDDRLVFAHTKVGRVNGENGKVQLAELTFTTIAAGKAPIELKRVKLVNSAVQATEPTTDARMDVEVTQQVVEIEVFPDIAGHWAENNIMKAATLGLVDGYPDGTFRPQAFITRAEFTAMLVRAIPMSLVEGQPLEFADLSEIPAWAVPEITAAVAAGIVTGYEDLTFRAARQITRAELAVMVMRTLGEVDDPAKTTSFADANQIPAWAHPSIAEAVDLGFVQGRGNNQFVPQANATRAEAVTLILKLYEYMTQQQ